MSFSLDIIFFKILTIICWFSAYGVIPVFIYGFASDRFQAILTRLKAKIECGSCTNLCKSKSNSVSRMSTPVLPPVRSGLDSEFH